MLLVQDGPLTLGIDLRSIPGDTMSQRGKAERLWNSRLSDLLWVFVLNLSRDVPATATSQATEQHWTQQLAPKEAHTHQALLPDNSHNPRKSNVFFLHIKI